MCPITTDEIQSFVVLALASLSINENEVHQFVQYCCNEVFIAQVFHYVNDRACLVSLTVARMLDNF